MDVYAAGGDSPATGGAACCKCSSCATVAQLQAGDLAVAQKPAELQASAEQTAAATAAAREASSSAARLSVVLRLGALPQAAEGQQQQPAVQLLLKLQESRCSRCNSMSSRGQLHLLLVQQRQQQSWQERLMGMMIK